MIQRTLKEVQTMLNGTGLKAESELIGIKGVTTDSRQVQPKNLFFPLVGENFNGHQFARKALELGATAIVWDINEENPPENIPVIFVEDTLKALQQLAKAYREQVDVKVVGVTGSNGKTTTKDMISSVLATTFSVHKTKGNFNNHIGLPLTLLSMSEETEIAVLEMGMSGKGEIQLLSEIAQPDAAVITNIGESHLLDLGSREGIAEAKLEIVAGLKEKGYFTYFGDEPLLQDRLKSFQFLTKTFGEQSQNDYFPTSITQESNGTSFILKNNHYFIPVLGKHNVYNALAAYSIGQYFGVNDEAIKKGLQEIEITGMRLELLKSEDDISIINDAYNASPTSMIAAIQLLEDLKGYKQKIVVLGDMLELGDQEILFHQQVGKTILEQEISHVLTYGKLGAEIAKGAKENLPEERVHHFVDKSELIQRVKEVAKAGDIILVKASRGMKLEEVVNVFI
ncbi:UDP-N-acetylmuramoyl-tripeptide--D-alanyl-D-alanine ligase [Metabacillus herbersteinensis]|uniref:UDP-N-acetylmuramoyl-tripeptide--D-alanyl-D-alanine ligase n=1 Tax=Metabacillus herbersteinensis TaxID=283816 RepID=A0ABV6GL63_9BACI